MPGDDSSDNLPDRCLRGLSSSKWLRDGRIASAAFMPDTRTAKERLAMGKPPGSEVSISWEDHAEVAQQVLSRHSGIHGAGRLTRAHIDYQNGMPGTRDALL